MADQRELRIGVLAGDGIGPEITDATVEVLHAAIERTGLKLRLTHCLVGWKAREQEGALLSGATEQKLRTSDGWIMGPTFAGEYPKDDRRKFKLFGAPERPARSRECKSLTVKV
jgi:3-isopropylmalate dehydrogenase